MNYIQILKKGENFLKKSKIKNPYLDTELILSKVVNRKREEILLNSNNKLKNTDITKFKNYLLRRYQKEPMAYILGYKHFWKHKFLINKSVLIPRPDTELVIEESLRYLPKDKSKKILDVGTGSGCIVVSLLKERPKCTATAIDISKNAKNVAKTFEAHGADYLCISSGGITTGLKIPIGPNYQVHLAKGVKDVVSVPVRTVGLITTAEQANNIIVNGEADLVALARAMLANPRWVWDASVILQQPIEVPPQYERSYNITK